MTVCKFWQRGDCRYGDSCRFEHPITRTNTRSSNVSSFPNQPKINNEKTVGNFDCGPRNADKDPSFNDYKLSHAEIERDLIDHPVWILSCYGPGKDAPVQLFGGKARELSFEEARLRYYELATQHRVSEANAAEDKLRSDAQRQMMNAKNDVGGAIQYILEGAQQHPNRIDVCSAGFNSTFINDTRNSLYQTPSFHQSTFTQRTEKNQKVPGSTEQSAPSQSLVTRPQFNSLQSQLPLDQSSNQISLIQPSSHSSFQGAGNRSMVVEGPIQSPYVPSPFSRHVHNSSQAANQLAQPLHPGSGQSTFGKPSNPFSARATHLTQSSTYHDGISGRQGEKGANESATQPKRDDGLLQVFNGLPVVYDRGGLVAPYVRRSDGQLQKIWFPRGRTFSKPEDLPLGCYTSDLQRTFQIARQAQSFEDGQLPSLPPRREWISYEL